MCVNCLNVNCTCKSTCTSCKKVKTDNVLYTGPNLSCSSIEVNTNLTTIIQQLSTLACSGTTSSTTTTTTTLNCFIWEAIITQPDTQDPEIIMVHSDFQEVALTSSYIGVGYYFITLDSPVIPLNPPNVIYTGTSPNGVIYVEAGGSVIVIKTYDFDGITPKDGVLVSASIFVKKCVNLPITPTTTTTTTII